MDKKDKQRLIKQVESYGDFFTQECACGCNRPVPFTCKGQRKYINDQHKAWANIPKMTNAAKTSRTLNNIPIENFREAVLKLKATKGWSLAEIAEKAGQQPGWLHSYMYDKRYKTIGRKTATSFFRRLSDLPEEASAFQQRTIRRQIVKTDRIIREIGVDPEHNHLDTEPFWK